MQFFSRLAFLSTATCALLSSTNPVLASQAADSTLAAEQAAIAGLYPLVLDQTTDPIQGISITGPSDMGGISFGTASVTTPLYFYNDNSNNLYATGTAANHWKTYRGAPAASWNATTTESLTETTSDGSAASTVILKLILTKTGAPADLTRSELFTWLRTANNITTTALAANNAGTAIGGVVKGTVAAGWTAKAWIDDGSATAIAGTLGPVEGTSSVVATTAGGAGSQITFTNNFSSLYSWNVATNSTTSFPMVYTAPGGRMIAFNVFPANLARTSDIATSFTGAINNASSKRFDQTIGGRRNTLASAQNMVTNMIESGGTNNIVTLLNNDVITPCAQAAAFVIGRFTSVDGTGKWGAFTNAPSNMTVAWSVNGPKVIATGTVGASGTAIPYSVDLTGLTVIKNDTNEVLTLTHPKSPYGIWLKCTDATGLDTSATANVDADGKSSLLASEVKHTMAAVTTVNAFDVKTIVTKATS